MVQMAVLALVTIDVETDSFHAAVSLARLG